METLTHYLSDRYEFHFIGIGYKGEIIHGEVTIYPCNLQGGDVYGVALLKRQIAELQPDLVFLLNDIWVLKNYGVTCSEEADQIPFIAYAALDGKIVDSAVMDGLSFLHSLVAYTKFARQELVSAFSANSAYLDGTVPNMPVIGHGVETKIFKPAGETTKIKSRVFAHLIDSHVNINESFIVLNGNRPHGRKRIDISIEAFARFARDKHDVYLYLHNSIIDDHERMLIQGWAEEFGVIDKILLPQADAKFVDDAGMNEIYNACDIGLNTSMGEGWGMVSMEHAATGKAQIVPEHSACAEIWMGIAATVAIENVYVPKFSLLELAEVSVAQVAQQLELLYADRSALKTIGKQCYQAALSPQYQWANVAEQWHQLFQASINAFQSTQKSG